MRTDTFLTYGQPEPPAELIPLRAGSLTMYYDPTNGMVRRIKLGEVEVLRGIYAAVRDRNWKTVPGVIRESVREVAEESFRSEFESDHHQGDIHFVWHGVIRGREDGTIRYELDGEARTTFRRNRIGFCVLHPIRECAGAHAKQIRVEQATKLVHMSQAQFMKVFKKVAGMTFVAHLTRVRITNALRLLRETDATIAEIAAKAGFPDQSYFDRRFKKAFGKSPRQFRKDLASQSKTHARWRSD